MTTPWSGSTSRRHRRILGVLLAIMTPCVNAEAQGVAISLGDAARMAAKQGGNVDIARARVSAADARAMQRRGALLPEFTGGIEQAQRTTNSATFGLAFKDPTGRPAFDPDGQVIGPIPTVDVRYRLRQSLFDAGKIATWRAAQSATDAAGADVDAQAEGAAATAAVAYVRAARAEAQVSARVADSALAADLLRIARDQLQAGVGIALDVTRAQSQLAGTRAQLILARSDRDRAMLELKRAMNMSLDAAVTLSDSLGGLAVERAPDEAASLAQAERSRADIRSLMAQETAQKRALSAIQWEKFPQLGVVVDQGVLGKDWTNMLPTYTWGVQLSIPIFDGYRRQSRQEEQIASTRETEVRLRELRAQTALDVRAAMLDLSATREQLDAVSERLSLSEQEVSQAQERFRAGVAGNSDVISALLALNQARTLRNDALASYQTARVSLARATGAVRQLP